MTKQKPVWRMNTGNRVPISFQDCSEVILTEDKDIICRLSNMVTCTDSRGDVYLEVGQYWAERVYAYQTNRTKAAKFERVKCDACRGYSEIIYEYCSAIRKYQITETCRECNGTGRMARRIK